MLERRRSHMIGKRHVTMFDMHVGESATRNNATRRELHGD